MKAVAAGQGRTDLKRFPKAADEVSAEIVTLFTTRPCVVCGKHTHGWGMVTDMHVSGPERFKRVCSQDCNVKFYTVMWARIVWVKGFIPHTPKK